MSPSSSGPGAPSEAPAAELPTRPVVFYDGDCGLCQRSVQFLLRHDRDERLAFAPLQGETAARLVPAGLRAALGSVVVWWPGEGGAREGSVSTRGDAVVGLVSVLRGVGWRVVGGWLRLVPRSVLNWGYDLVARHRHWVDSEACLVPEDRASSRFLP